MIRDKIAEIIYDELGYMYCDNCRYNSEIDEDEPNYGCDDCHRKYNGWGISMAKANRLAEMAIEALSADRPTVDKEYLIDLIQEAVYDGEACAKLIDLVDRPTGEWVDDCTCSICHWMHEDNNGFALITKYNYCPNCGARMRGEEE